MDDICTKHDSRYYIIKPRYYIINRVNTRGICEYASRKYHLECSLIIAVSEY